MSPAACGGLSAMSRTLVYSMQVSLDGYMEGPGRDLGWAIPDEELHTFHNEQARAVGADLYGRRLYELMAAYWPTAGDDPAASPSVVEFARIWNATPRVVFSSTLEQVDPGSRLVRGDAVEEVARLKQGDGGELAAGGAGLGGSLLRAGLVDEIRLFAYPIVLGAGTPFFPPLDERIPLELIDTRRFDSGVVYTGYRVKTT
jgi:dihydrofolate reductase